MFHSSYQFEGSNMSNPETDRVKELLEPHGFEIYPFKIGWYNDSVDQKFTLPYEYDSLALLVISTPDLFDKSLIPFICRNECPGTQDLLDQCIKQHFSTVKKNFPNQDIEGIHDFEMLPSRRPRVLVQTAGHVAGACYYYQRSDVVPDAWDQNKKIFGVSIHPKYGGWFALRGVLIFKDCQCPELVQKGPTDVLKTREKKVEVLERFNGNWKDWTYRDVIPVEQKYGEQQKLYFATLPKDRQDLIGKWKSEIQHSGGPDNVG